MFARRQAKTHSRLMRDELGQSVDHLRLAAAHAAGGTAAAVAPRWQAMRGSMEPTIDRSVGKLMGAATVSTRRASKQVGKAARLASGKKAKPRRRWPMMIGGMVAAGAAVGAAGAAVSRRRQRQWDEYGPTDTETRLREEAQSMVDSAQSGVGTTRDALKSATDRAANKTSDVLEQVSQAAEPSTGRSPTSPGAGAAGTTGTAGERLSPSGSGTPGSRNSRP